jgi:outer membrane receptor for ferrienterochelin and colicins
VSSSLTRLTRWLLSSSFAALVAATTAHAQTGVATGIVRAQGHPLPRARVDARLSTSITTSAYAIANDSGRYTLSLAPGEYLLSFRLLGYANKIVDGVRIVSGSQITVDAELAPSPIALDQVVVTAGRRAESAQEAIASVTVVETPEIQEHVALTPADHIASAPGVDLAVQGLLGRQFVARGFNSTLNSTLLMMTDYRNAAIVAPRSNVSYFLPQTSDDIERIEIVRGPSSALYGPNASDGVVHFITKSPLDYPGSSASITAGGRSLFDGAGRFSTRVGDRFAFKISGSYTRGDEWPAIPNPAERLPRDPISERAGGELRADYRVSPTGTAVLTLGRSDAVRIVDYTSIGAYEIKNWRTDFAQLRYNDGRFFAQAYWNGDPGKGTSTSLQTGAVTLDHSGVMAGQIQHGFDVGSKTSLTYGVDVQRTDPQSLGTISGRNEQDDISTEVGGYAEATMKLTPRLEMNAAARVDKHDRLPNAVFSPRLGFSYSPSNGHSFRVSYNRAFATPNSTQLFIDILAARLDPLPFSVRAVGVPRDGLRFPRGCGGATALCASSPFAPGQQLPVDATLLWPAVVQIMRAQNIDLSGIPAPKASDVGTTVRMLDPSAGVFRDYTNPINDIGPLRPTITNSLELGYRGTLGHRAVIDMSGYLTRRQDFVSPVAVVTPNIFLSTPSLATYLGRFMPAAQANALAAGIGGLSGDPKVTGIPLGTIAPGGTLAGSDILLSYQNVGDVRLWGADLSGDFAATDDLTLRGAFSFVNQNFFGAAGPGDVDLSTNAPRAKAQGSARYAFRRQDASAELRVRYAGAFRMVDGVLVGDVPAYTIADFEVGMSVPSTTSARLTLTAQNLTNKRHSEFFGHPQIGRLLLARLQYRF